jgi:hypothetical protein
MLKGLEADKMSEDSTLTMLDISIFTSLGLGFFTGFAQSPQIAIPEIDPDCGEYIKKIFSRYIRNEEIEIHCILRN